MKNNTTRSILRTGTMVLSGGLLVASMTQPAFYIDREDYDAYASGVYLFFLGWMGVLGGSIAALLWLANPLFLLSQYWLFRNNKDAVITSLCAVVLAGGFSLIEEMVTKESGATSRITSLEAGYWLWLSSMSVLFVGTVACFGGKSTPTPR